MKTGNYLSIVAGLGFGVLAIFSGLVANLENAALRNHTQSRLFVTGTPDVSLALSTTSDHLLTESCINAITSVMGRVLPTSQRQNLLQTCETLLHEMVQTSPNNAYAWFVLAYIDWENAEAMAFNTALTNAYTSGPNEQWLAELRVPLAERAKTQLSPEADLLHGQDLALLVQSRRGINSIAQRYIDDPGFRARITDIVEAMPQEHQLRFLNTIKSKVRGR